MIKVAITGPESSGKTSLAESLAAHYQAVLVTEYAREYLTALDRRYRLEDLHAIARTQLKLEKEAIRTGARLVIFDTDVIVLKIWYSHKYGEVPEWLENAIFPDRYDLHILTRPDIPYEPDPLRENPGKGQFFFDLFQKELEAYGLPYRIVGGDRRSRVEQSKKAIDEITNGLTSG